MDDELDWDHLLSMASRHRLMPLLYVNLNSICPEKVPEDVLQDLKDFYLENTRKNLMLTGELVKVMQLLEDNGIDAVTYKGPVLAHSVYGNIGFRQFNDLDILTDKEGALKAKNLMISEEYVLYEPIIIKDSTYMKLCPEYAFKSNNGSTIEINWDFSGMLFSFSSNPEFLFKELEKIEINGFKFYTLNPENQILMLCVHAAKHNWSRLSWILDISEFAKNTNINWNHIIQKSKILGINRILMINLHLASKLFGLIIPKEILKYLNGSVVTISQQIIEWTFLDYKTLLNISEKYFLYSKRREKPQDKIREFINLVKPTYNDHKYIPFPDSLFPLLYIIKPFLLIKRFKIYFKSNE